MKMEVITLSEERKASLTCYTLAVKGKFVFSKRPAIVVIPGGAYAYCSDREADQVAFSFMKAGYDAFILRYSCKDVCQWPRPLQDYEEAMEIIKSNADKWGVDTNRIVTIGFSAGGHLAACTATMAVNKPAASILVYPALDRDVIDMCMSDLPEPAKFVDSKTCPCFLIAARDDDVVDVKSMVHFELALIDHCVPYESHIYAFGGHGFSIVEDLNKNGQASRRLNNWIDEAIGWLEEVIGKQTQDEFIEPNPKAFLNGNNNAVLSVDCTLRYLLRQSKEVNEVIEPVLKKVYEVLDFVDKDTINEGFGSNTLRRIMEKLALDKESIEETNNKLKNFKN